MEASESGLESSEGAKTHHIAWYPSGSDETILASLRSLCNSMANVTDRELTWTGNEVPISLLSLADDLTEQVGTCRDRFLSMACGLTPRPRAKKNYSLFIAYDPKDVAGRGAARFLQLALQRELRGLVVEELGDEVEGVHMNDDLDEVGPPLLTIPWGIPSSPAIRATTPHQPLGPPHLPWPPFLVALPWPPLLTSCLWRAAAPRRRRQACGGAAARADRGLPAPAVDAAAGL